MSKRKPALVGNTPTDRSAGDRVIASAIIRGCTITAVIKSSGRSRVQTDKTGRRHVRLDPEVLQALRNPNDQRDRSRIDVRVEHWHIAGLGERWNYHGIAVSPELEDVA